LVLDLRGGGAQAMNMSRPFALVLLPLSALALILGLFGLAPVLRMTFGEAQGAMILLGLYWWGFCLPLGLYFCPGRDIWRLGWRDSAAVIIVAVLIAAVLLVLLVLRHPQGFPFVVILAALGFALINGSLEELFWRGAWLRVYGRSLPMYFLGYVLFVGWHVPLAMMTTIPFQGGVWGLTAGAAALGAVWAWMAWRTGSIGWSVVSHVATNAIVLLPVIASALR
jgi:membrane protease YdiL (CAAX protease family)